MTVEDERPQTLEAALAKSEADADALLRATAVLTAAAKRFRTAAQTGALRDLGASLTAAETALANVTDQLAHARRGWHFDGEAYLTSGGYTQELLETAERMQVRMYEGDERLYSYPVLVRILPGDLAVQLDRTRERRLRPTAVVNRLKELQRRPPRFRPEAFLEALFAAYQHLGRERNRQQTGPSPVEELARIYELLTLLPGQTREYSRQEFARDVYLLDRSGVTATRGGYAVSLPASTGTRSASRTIRTIGEDGQEKVYYGISFSRPD